VAVSPARWGWHQLDPRWAQRVVADAALARGALVLDVGAGLGALTGPLVDAGARVIAIEAHPARGALLRQRFGSSVVVVRADARDLRLPNRPYSVVANPPFGVTSALLRRLLQPGSRLVSARIVLQQQAAARWAAPAAPGAARWSRSFRVRLGMPIPRNAFTPRPHVPARVLVIQRIP